MPKRSLDDWMRLWDVSFETCSPRKPNLKAFRYIFQVYMDDRNDKDACHFHGKKIAEILPRDSIDFATNEIPYIGYLLQQIKKNLIHVREDDALLLILDVVKIKTGVDYFNLSVDDEPAEDCNMLRF